MKLGQRLKVAWGVISNKYQQTTSGDFSKWFSGGKSRFLWRAGGKLASNETIFAAISRLSNSVATMPVKLYKEFEPIYSHPVADKVANSPNNNMTSFDWIRTLEVHRNTYGNGYAIKIYGARYQLEQIAVLDPTRVEPIVEASTGELWYQVLGDKGTYYVHNLDMVHVKHIHTSQNGYKGISPIDVLSNTIEFDKQVRRFSLESMEGSINASFILKYDTHLSEDKKTEIINNFRQFYQDNGGVLIQESGTTITPIERDFLDTKVFEVEKITRSRVATVFNMPSSMLGETDGASYSSQEQMSLEYVTYTLLPIIRHYEQEFNRKLITMQERQSGLYFKFNVGAFLRGDQKTRGEFYFKGIRSAWFKPNEVRAYEELPPEPGGNQLYISGDLYPLNTPVSERKSRKTGG
ncbi:MAG: phage portal protein [Candidatus Pristimantibacillus lignocellulolyticus]|uniref:Phage portal protein n=1 Tax=Candidatus Pristimantibacillus lignocellulolyticus TaxID=2994561 RepID=A0A9J6ZER2_9BACL|nr:MAG: phage portal protein [Candidatus Pristimantibacillus lignocellulolyticus]